MLTIPYLISGLTRAVYRYIATIHQIASRGAVFPVERKTCKGPAGEALGPKNFAFEEGHCSASGISSGSREGRSADRYLPEPPGAGCGLLDNDNDFDNDGAVDVLAIHNGARVLLRNKAARRNHWLGVKLVVQKSNRDAMGACVTYQAENLERSRTRVGGGSFFGVGSRMALGL
jgi:hypothetical protein